MKKQKDNEYVIRSELDPISALHSLNPFRNKQNTTDIKAKSWNLLEEHNSDVLDRIDPDTEIGI
jgi:hypothetical protein